MTEQRATRSEVAGFLLDHYRNLTLQTNSPTYVPMLDAIDAYTREPELKAELAAARERVADLQARVARGSSNSV